MMYIKLHESEDKGSMLVAMCDESLIDKVLEEGDVVMDIKSYHDFYMGALVDKSGAKKRISEVRQLHSANIVGKESVAVALEMHLVEKGNVRRVGDVPYAHAYAVKEVR